jgi:tricorn protease
MTRILGLLALLACSSLQAQSEKPLLMQGPTLNASHIVFAYGGELWSVSREGGEALQLTAGPGQKSNPHFSPDGKMIAFTGQYGGNLNVYLLQDQPGKSH